MSLYDELYAKYHGRRTPGKAFFWNDSFPGSPSLHFDVSDFQWTFSYGSDHQESYVEGTLFYNDGFFDGENPRLPKDLPTNAGFYVDQESENTVLYVLISFYAPNSRDELIGEFLARDLFNAGGSSELLHKSGLEGVWEFQSGESLYDRLNRKYNGRKTFGETFFRSDAGAPASLRFVNDLSWKFLYNNPDGQAGIFGTLFYNDGFFDGDASLPRDQPTEAGFFVDQANEDGQLFLHIKFYAPDSEDEFLGEFLARDSRNAAESSGLLREQLAGDWEFEILPYPHHTPAVAFFFKDNSGTPFFRLVANELGWEFSDGGYVGAGTLGTLSYRAGFFDGQNPRLDPNGLTNADFYVDQYRENSKLTVHIKFYAPGSHHDLLGEFTANDLFNRSGESGILEQRRTAAWGRASHGTTTSYAFKNPNATRITITVVLVRKWAEMDCKTDEKIYGEDFNVPGRVTLKGSPPAYGMYVRWYRDCAIFVDSPNARDFTAFFLRTNEADTLGSTDGLGWDVNWRDV